jgi:hypothetical protein
MATCVGPPFWDSLLGAGTDGQYPEYVSPDIFLGEYVAKLEQDTSSDAAVKYENPGSYSSSNNFRNTQTELRNTHTLSCIGS